MYISQEYLRSPYLEVIGRGMKFPSCFDESRGIVDINGGLERINQSIYLILSTRLGERWGFPEFGSRLANLVFEDKSLMVFGELADMFIREALEKWEKRVIITGVKVDLGDNVEPNTIPISISYGIRNSNIIGSYVYPFVTTPMRVTEAV